MCIAFPGRVLAIDEGDAVVEIDGRRRRASLRMCADVVIGDWVLVGAGSVLRRLEADEAALSETPLGRLATMAEVVDATWFLLENGAVNGVELIVDGGWHTR